MNFKHLKQLTVILFIFSSFNIFAQDERIKLPLALKNSFFEVNIGAINYDFGASQFLGASQGYTITSVKGTTYPAVRLVLFGYQFNKYLAAQITYMRPVNWVYYYYNNGTEFHRSSVWMNVGGLTLKPELPLGNKFSIYGEAGLGLITRHGFEAPDGTPLVTDANYGTFLFGAGLKYHINKQWSLQLTTTYSPEKKSVSQPSTTFIAGGFSYKLAPTSEKNIDKAKKLGYIHPKNIIQIGYSSNILGYGVNNFLSSDKFPVFWGGNVEVRQGMTFNYQRNAFHSPKYFSLDWGVETGLWQTTGNQRNGGAQEQFFTLSVYPVFRFDFLHTQPVDAYFYYSVAAPTYISKIIIDGLDTGKHFTFQDNMGLGIFFGKERSYNAELKIGHYSNGNIFTSNEAVKIPLSLNIGYTFN